MAKERLSKKERDLLRVLLALDKKLKEDFTSFKNKSKKERNVILKDFYGKKIEKICKSLKFKMCLWFLELDKNFITKKNAYRSLKNLEKKDLIKIKKDKHYFGEIKITPKGIQVLKFP